MRSTRRAAVTLAALVFAAGLACPSDAVSQIRTTPGAAEFTRDLNEIVRLVETHHPSPFQEISRKAWLREAAAIRAAATVGASARRLATRMMAWVASLGDGHTNLVPAGLDLFARWYPVRFHQFSDGLYITGAAKEGIPFNGGRVLRIGGRPAAEAAALQATLQGSDNAFGAGEERYLLSNAGVIEGLELTGAGEPLPLLLESDGETRRVVLEPVTAPFSFGWRFWGEMYGPPLEDDHNDALREWRAAFDGASVESYRTADPDRPPHLQYRLPYRYTRLGPSDDIFYMVFNFTQNWGDETLHEFLDRMYTAIDSAGDPTLVLDLRYNSGGDGSLVQPIVHGIIRRPQLDDPNRLFVLTGPKTFSAAVMLVGDLAEHTEATFVGTPPGAAPNSHGDARGFVLPGTGMRLQVSTLYHQYGASGDTTNVFPIDVPAPMSSRAYFAGRDPALEAVTGNEDIRPVSVIALAEGADSARRVVAARTAEADSLGWQGWRPFSEGELKYVGYEELLRGRPNSAAAILSLVTDVYPDSWDAFDRRGQALEEAGEWEKAIESYRRSLELDPDNAAAAAAIARLKGGG